MILYVNGDSNSNGEDLARPQEDSWASLLAKRLDCQLINEAKSGTSNPRILRTASNALAHCDARNTLVIIGWTSWEREEWFHNGQYYDVNAGGHDQLPTELEQRYKQWVTEQTPEQQSIKSLNTQSQLHRLHRSFMERRLPHLFFNALMPFQHNLLNSEHLDWHNNYLGPYDNDLSYYWYLKNHGRKPTKNNHFSEDAQAIWADVLYNYIKDKALI